MSDKEGAYVCELSLLNGPYLYRPTLTVQSFWLSLCRWLSFDHHA
nr:MAG TPA: hypothetical protein [Caudoviricetes sp.]